MRVPLGNLSSKVVLVPAKRTAKGFVASNTYHLE
jgi:hypothetical protein